MGDSDEHYLKDEVDDDAETINLTSFLFGNVDELGELESDVLDIDSRKQLAQLARLGLGSIIKEMIDESDVKCNSDVPSLSQGSDSGFGSYPDSYDYDEDLRSPSAIDFFDINEAIEDDTPIKQEFDTDDTCDLNVRYSSVNDSYLMPPPRTLQTPDALGDNQDSESTGDESKKKLNTPLAAMLPEKYKDVDVTKLFPDFRHGQVLRFSRVFGLGKAGSLPQIWRNIRKKRKKQKHKEKAGTTDSHSDEEKPKTFGWNFNFGDAPSREQLQSDDEDKFLKAVEVDNKDEEKDNTLKDDSGPKVADWRFGPAQIWYDMLEVSEIGDNFDYGFKMTRENAEDDQHLYKFTYSNDSFLMVTQQHWEDEVIWEGNDIKHKG